MNLRQLVERGDRPFATQPQVGRYFPAASTEDARRRLGRAIDRGEGPGVVIGGAGSGKSLLLQVLAAQYRDRFDVVLLACSQLCTRRALLQAIHFELGLDYRLRDEGQLRLSLLDQLLSNADGVEGLLLLVDEAQTLPAHLLEELRVLTNLARGGLPRVRLVLAGLSSLEEKLASPELESFSQRLATRCYLAPFTRDETSQYIRAQLNASGFDPQQVFAAPALDAVFNATDGVPRLVNQLCDRSLVLADARKVSQVDAAMVQSAWADLQQLPTPWETPRENRSDNSTISGESVVEFGSLSAETVPPSSTPPSSTPLPSPTPAQPMALAPRPEQVEQPELTIDVGRLASRMAWMPMLNEEWSATEDDDSTVLDDDVVAAPPKHASPNKRPRVSPAGEPEAVDPFAVPFDEEELVLDNFAAISGLFGTRTPRVENRRDPSFARFVEHVLETSPAPKSAVAPAVKPSAAEVERDRDDDRPRIRLAVVSDSPSPQESADPRVQKLVAQAEELDFDPPSREAAKRFQHLFSRGDDFGAAPVKPSPAPPAAQLHEEVDADDAESPADCGGAILLIEDEPTPAALSPAEVRREGYRQLFSRLRHGA